LRRIVANINNAQRLLNFEHDELGDHFANAGKMTVAITPFCWSQQNGHVGKNRTFTCN